MTAQSGFAHEASWIISSAPVILGRATDCNVILEDASVSRHHCELVSNGHKVRLIDLGSRNPARVNGVVVRTAELQAGDTFCVGAATFRITVSQGEPHTVSGPASGHTDETVSLADLGLFPGEHPESKTPAWSGAREDYEMLFRLGRTLSLCSDTSTLCSRFTAATRLRFGDVRIGIFRRRDRRWTNLTQDQSVADAEIKLFLDAVKSASALVGRGARFDVPTDTVVAPINCAGANLGVARLQLPSASPRYSKPEVLTVFAAMAEILAPFLHTVEHLELLAAVNARLAGYNVGDPPLIGSSSLMRDLRKQLTQAAGIPMNVLLMGETGTGKELAARALHNESPRATEPFVVINCAAIPESLVESELFGHMRGAFTGAMEARVGLVEQAHNGTLFLDEVSELSPANQARLLRVIEYGTFRPVGAQAEKKVDVRFIAASNRNLPGTDFREDLYHRLAGMELRLPALRERPSDVLELAQYFLDRLAGQHGHLLRRLSPDAQDALSNYHWPGNVRQLRNVVERAAHVSDSAEILPQQLFDQTELPQLGAGPDSYKSLAELEREQISRVLRACDNNVSQAANILGIHRSTLYQKVSAYGLRD